MADDLTFGDVRRMIARTDLEWHPRDLPDDKPLPRKGLGAELDELVLDANAPRLDLREIAPRRNPLLAARQVRRGLSQREALDRIVPRRLAEMLLLRDADEADGDALPPDMGSSARPRAVDWRDRWGQNWITSMRDQGVCSACWAFAGTALIEAMLRIETGMWAQLSEGDVHRGVGKTCPNAGNSGEVSRYFDASGLCDPGSWPWRTDTPPFAPTPDRNGRAVRGPAFKTVSVADTKDWLDTVGPLYVGMTVWDDFRAYGSGVYRRSTDPQNEQVGGHAMLLIGYDDDRDAWLVKNSWGTAWGIDGFGWIGYGEADIDTWARRGLEAVNPDPWTKRRLHNGVLYESGNGRLSRNLEVAQLDRGGVQHSWRVGGAPWTWGHARRIGDDAAADPTLTGTTFDRNMEIVYATTSGRLHHWWTRGSGSEAWRDGGVFGPAGCKGMVGFVQGDHGAPGNFEVVVATGGRLHHVWRSGGRWRNGVVFGDRIGERGCSLIQSSFGVERGHGNLEVVAAREDGRMQLFWRSSSDFRWRDGAIFGDRVAGAPILIQGQYGMTDEQGPHGNFELCVASGGRVQHWWRHNGRGPGSWRHSATFGSGVVEVLGLCQSSWNRNLEVIVRRSDGRLQHFFRNNAWRAGPILPAP